MAGLRNNSTGLSSEVITAATVAIAVFLVWVGMSISAGRRRQRREREMEAVVRGNVDDAAVFDLTVRAGGSGVDVANVTYDFEAGRTTARCAPGCDRSSGTKVRFKYYAPDFEAGRLREQRQKTCICDLALIDDVGAAGEALDNIEYRSIDTDVEAYNSDAHGDASVLFRDIAAQFGRTLV